MPAALTDLTQATANGLGQTAGPFIATMPIPAPGGSPAWSGTYTYTSSSTGTFSITANGDGTTIIVPVIALTIRGWRRERIDGSQPLPKPCPLVFAPPIVRRPR